MQEALGLLGDLKVAQTQFDAWPERDTCREYADRIADDVAACRRTAMRAWPAAGTALKRLKRIAPMSRRHV